MTTARRTARSLLLLLALFFALTLTSSAAATPIGDKKASLKMVEAKLQAITQQSDLAVEKYNQANTRLEGVRTQIKQNQELLAAAERRLALANAQLAARAKSIYKTQGVDIVDVVLAADTFDQIVTQMDLLARIGNSDVDTVTAVEAYRADIKARRVKLDADRRAAAQLLATAASQKQAILDLQARYQQMTAGIKADIRKLEAQQAAAAQAAAQAAAHAAQQAAQNSGGSQPSSDPGPVADPGGGHPEVASYARQFVGKVMYKWGGADPGGFDCSGLVMYCYQHAAGISLAHGATDQQRASTSISYGALQAGDLIFYGDASWSHHVAIYSGGGMMIEAPGTGRYVQEVGMRPGWAYGRL